MRAGLVVGDKAACRFSHQGRKEEMQLVGPFGRSGEHVLQQATALRMRGEPGFQLLRPLPALKLMVGLKTLFRDGKPNQVSHFVGS